MFLVYANSSPGKFNVVFSQTDSMKSHKIDLVMLSKVHSCIRINILNGRSHS